MFISTFNVCIGKCWKDEANDGQVNGRWGCRKSHAGEAQVSYSGLYGNFQTMSFLVVKGDFEKITPQIYTIATHEQNGDDVSQPEKQGKEERHLLGRALL